MNFRSKDEPTGNPKKFQEMIIYMKSGLKFDIKWKSHHKLPWYPIIKVFSVSKMGRRIDLKGEMNLGVYNEEVCKDENEAFTALGENIFWTTSPFLKGHST